MANLIRILIFEYELNYDKLPARYIAEGYRKLFFWCPNSIPQVTQFSIWDYLIGLFAFLQNCYLHFFNFFCDVAILTVSLSLWLSVKKFQKLIEIEDKHIFGTAGLDPRKVVISEYKCLTQFTRHLNNAFSRITLFFLFSSVFVYSNDLASTLLERPVSQKVSNAMFTINFIATLVIFGDVASRGSTCVEDWLQRKASEEGGSGLKMEEFIVMLQNAKSSKIAISAGILVVNWSTICSVSIWMIPLETCVYVCNDSIFVDGVHRFYVFHNLCFFWGWV